jgi:hypothetical protein
MIKDTIKLGVELYTGLQVQELLLESDPAVDGSYAIRATVRPWSPAPKTADQVVDFVLLAHWRDTARRLTPEAVDRWLEEGQFASWPPASGRLRF